ncbi:MAG: Gfo/Idh/MocA family oxidoreductase [Halioglobus sp.]|nr:Gfo/Idh/MocA family oxidoreductase [Halioglobus sp.]
MSDIDRRQLLKGAVAGLSSLALLSLVEELRAAERSATLSRADFAPAQPVTAITLGAGNRGNVYGGYAGKYPHQLDIVGVAEPVAVRNERYMARHDIAPANSFVTWEHVFDRPKFADAVIISTPDDLHQGPAMAALRAGYHVLLEKPVSPSLEECLEIRELTGESGRIVAVCHVLRYTPYFRELKRLVDVGAVGELVSIQHLEPIQHEHMAHSYVRGNWHDSRASTPIILGKSCHDLDILHWLAGRRCERISAFGDLKWFRRANAPRGSTARCADGCKVERDCPYSAVKLYLESDRWSYVFDLPRDEEREGTQRILDENPQVIGRLAAALGKAGSPAGALSLVEADGALSAELAALFGAGWQQRLTQFASGASPVQLAAKKELLATTNYGRCVYRTDNDQPDHYVANIQFEDSVTASFAMEAFTSYHGRRTRIMGSMGDIVGDMGEMEHTDFRTGEKTRWQPPNSDSGHGGGDFGLVYDWVRAISTGDSSGLTTTIDASIESHAMALAAERSRLKGTVETL